jgi:hypothetical protein
MIETISGIGPSAKFVTGIPPTAPAAGTVNGAAIDRMGFANCVVEVEVGAVTGAPTTQTLDVKVQHSDTSGGTYADFVPGAAGTGAVAQLTAINTRKRKSIDLRAAKRFVRLVAVTAFTGGTAPTFFQCAKMVLAGADAIPAQVDD